MVKGKIFTRAGLLEGSVLIEDGIISKVAHEIRIPADQTLDYSGKGLVVLPGFIDMHVHLRDFELSYKEDLRTGTGAAAAGGFTVVADMPNTKPVVNTPLVLKERDRLARKEALVDYGIYYGVQERAAHLTSEVEAIALGFKVSMPEFYYTEKRRTVEDMFEFAAERHMLVVTHAENPEFFVKTSMGEIGTPEAEASAIKDFAACAFRYGFEPHVTHLSSAAGLEECLRWKGRLGLTIDTCPHYLLLTKADILAQGGIAKIKPALKSREDIEALLKGLKEGKVDAITSDHSPHLLTEKLDPQRAPPGFPGLETSVPLMLGLMEKGLLTLEDLVLLYVINPAKILGISKAGSIEKGKVGNLTILDLDRKGKIEPHNFVSKAKYSPFEGREVKGTPISTIVRGQPVMLDRELVASKGKAANVKTYG